jgi:hypothetical protein
MTQAPTPKEFVAIMLEYREERFEMEGRKVLEEKRSQRNWVLHARISRPAVFFELNLVRFGSLGVGGGENRKYLQNNCN